MSTTRRLADRFGARPADGGVWIRAMSSAGPLADLLGARPAEMNDGQCRWDLTIRPEHMNPYGVVHGGVIYSLVDYAMGGAMVSRLKAGERCATVEVKINYLATVSDGGIRAEARVVERTNRIGVLEARVFAGTERLIAIATGTFYIHGGASRAHAVDFSLAAVDSSEPRRYRS